MFLSVWQLSETWWWKLTLPNHAVGLSSEFFSVPPTYPLHHFHVDNICHVCSAFSISEQCLGRLPLPSYCTCEIPMCPKRVLLDLSATVATCESGNFSQFNTLSSSNTYNNTNYGRISNWRIRKSWGYFISRSLFGDVFHKSRKVTGHQSQALWNAAVFPWVARKPGCCAYWQWTMVT